MWRGWARSQVADRYEAHYRSEVVSELSQVPGFRGAQLLRRTAGDETEFVSLTFFDDLDAVRGFAGGDYERAVVADAAREVLTRFDDRVVHYEVAGGQAGVDIGRSASSAASGQEMRSAFGEPVSRPGTPPGAGTSAVST
jgi:heme-degrading monooxygenase HmoA